MSDVANNETTPVSEKPVIENDDVQFPPFPEPTDEDFEDDILEEERNYYKLKFKDLNTITSLRLHCSSCDRHLGCSVQQQQNRMRPHPMLRTLVCHTCLTFYNSGEFEKGDDGSELYCRWCGQGGQVYCCSDCPHVFCAKCIKRNLGTPKIKEIEEVDDWKCFKCNNRCLWDLRATCWAVLRYCDLKSKITNATQDPHLKEAYKKHCVQDHSECCRNKFRRKEKELRKKEVESASKKCVSEALISKIPPTIQVKKFASISMEDSPKQEKKAQKRAASPKTKPIIIKNPIAISTKGLNHMGMATLPKKVRMPNSAVINPVRFNNDKKVQQNFQNYPRIRPKPAGTPMSIMFNGYNNTGAYSNDNINLSLDSLTQGLDMSAVAVMAGSSNDDDVVCTPDFPLEPLCEVTEDNGDDDVQCMTPGPVVAPKSSTPFLTVRAANMLPDLSPDNVVQMTDNDVTVNANTGGLKFRVDPQTLSSNKMYRLPDGRIFAINANPSMPGGYSATIVAVTDNGAAKSAKGTTFAAKLSAVSATPTPPPKAQAAATVTRRAPAKRNARPARLRQRADTARLCDLNVPVEWYRYNLIDAIDAMEYSLSRLHQLKKDTTSIHLRTRSLSEMRNLHKTLERTLNTSATRFKDIRDNLNKEFKQYAAKKANSHVSDDDDVEILHEDENDDPIFIDENSMESTMNENQGVDLTAVGSSDHNESNEQSLEKNDYSRNEGDICSEVDSPSKQKNNRRDELSISLKRSKTSDAHSESELTSMVNSENQVHVIKHHDSKVDDDETKRNGDSQTNSPKRLRGTTDTFLKIIKQEEKADDAADEKLNDDILNENSCDIDQRSHDPEISEEMIERLLKDENVGNGEEAPSAGGSGRNEDLV